MNVSKIADKIQKNPSQTVDLYLDSLDELVEYENYGEKSRKSLNPKINDYLNFGVFNFVCIVYFVYNEGK